MNKETHRAKYRISPTLLDSFYGYINSDDIWEKYWGKSDNPSITAEEFHEKQFNSLIDRLNNVPIPQEESEAADYGTAFNEIVDCLIDNRKSDMFDVTRGIGADGNVVELIASYNGRNHFFPLDICKEVAGYCEGAVTQHKAEGFIDTKYGEVYLIGYLDEFLPTCKIVDIKTTSGYDDGKFENNFQHHIYPYIVNRDGYVCTQFEYLVVAFTKNKQNPSIKTNFKTYIEQYTYDDDFSKRHIKEWCEILIEFVEEHRQLINNNKFFNFKD